MNKGSLKNWWKVETKNVYFFAKKLESMYIFFIICIPYNLKTVIIERKDSPTNL